MHYGVITGVSYTAGTDKMHFVTSVNEFSRRKQHNPDITTNHAQSSSSNYIFTARFNSFLNILTKVLYNICKQKTVAVLFWVEKCLFCWFFGRWKIWLSHSCGSLLHVFSVHDHSAWFCHRAGIQVCMQTIQLCICLMEHFHIQSCCGTDSVWFKYQGEV